MDTQNVKSGQNGQTDDVKFVKLVNEIKKKINLKLYEVEFIDIYEPEEVINGRIYINMNKKNEIYSQNVESFRMVRDLSEEDFYLKLIFETGFSMISISIIETIRISNSTLDINVGVE